MRKLFNIISRMAVIAGIMAGLAACYPDVHHRGGPANPDDGPGRGPGEEEKTNVLNLKYGYGDCYGQYYTNDTDNYLVYLCAGETDEEGYFKNDGIILTLDILSSKKGNLTLDNGYYLCSDEGGVRTFVPTYSSKESEYEGSVLYIQKNKNSFGYYAITDGKLNITRKVTGAYTITGNITAGGKTYEVKYNSLLDLQNGLPDEPDGPDEPDNPVNPGQNDFPAPDGSKWAAKALYQGPCAENKSIDEYTLYLSLGEYAANGVDFKDCGTEIAIEVLTPKGDGHTIYPNQNYTCVHSNPKAYQFYDGFEENGEIYPSYFYRQYSNKEGDYKLEPITDGVLEVGQNMDKTDYYYITFTYKTASNTYKIRYEGDVKFETQSQTQATGMNFSARRSASGRSKAAVKREVSRNRIAR